MTAIRLQDLLAALVTLVLLAAVVALVFLQREIPDFLSGAFGAGIGYTLRGGVQAANDLRHNRRSPPV